MLRRFFRPPARHAADGPPLDAYLPVSGNHGYRVEHYDLVLDYAVDSNELAATATLTVRATDAIDVLILDCATHLDVTDVTVDGRAAGVVQREPHKLAITPTKALKPGKKVGIVVDYEGCPRPVRGPWGQIGWDETSAGVSCANQPNGAPSWFPCNDHPSNKAPYRITLTADADYHVQAGGLLTSATTVDGQTRWVYEQPAPTPTYLMSIQIGEYRVQELTRVPVPVDAVLPAQGPDAAERGFGRQVEILDAFIEMFGPYPFGSYTVVVVDEDFDIPVEAMAMSVFGANLCDQSERSERLMAHELAHQWFGNSITLAQWRHIWLHEGFACYAEWLWTERSRGRTRREWADYYYAKLAATEVETTLADPGVKHMFDDWVYKRGALTVYALHLELGDEKFFELLRQWLRDYRHSSVTTDDFTALAQTYSADSLQPLWTDWLYTAALPPLPRVRD